MLAAGDRQKSKEASSDTSMITFLLESITPQGFASSPSALPSIGSAGHEEGTCRRCCFFPKDRCLNGQDCNFCHFEHDKRRRKKNKRKGKVAESPASEAPVEILSESEDLEIVSEDPPCVQSTQIMQPEAPVFHPEAAHSQPAALACSDSAFTPYMLPAYVHNSGDLGDEGFQYGHYMDTPGCPYGIMGAWQEDPAWIFLDNEATVPPQLCHADAWPAGSQPSQGQPELSEASPKAAHSPEKHEEPKYETKLRIRGKIRRDVFRRPVFAGA